MLMLLAGWAAWLRRLPAPGPATCRSGRPGAGRGHLHGQPGRRRHSDPARRAGPTTPVRQHCSRPRFWSLTLCGMWRSVSRAASRRSSRSRSS
jgi:hypothetical protein